MFEMEIVQKVLNDFESLDNIHTLLRTVYFHTEDLTTLCRFLVDQKLFSNRNHQTTKNSKKILSNLFPIQKFCTQFYI